MTARAFQLSEPAAPAKAGVMLLMRWLLVLVIAVDLISSPFHAHHHESGPEGYSSHASQLDAGHSSFEQAAQDDDHLLHVDSDNADADHRGGHSMSALQGTPIQLASPDSAPKFLALVPLFVFVGLLTQPMAEALVRWRPGRERVPIPLFRTVPPDGRAPPSLHV
ncbi:MULTISPECIES: hypothetical protein [unclassified Variovorax]|uniref:hypothetical protein n=1 Tax=unclassified Variovorax TaxID=663243 RepID=UPI003F457723